MSEIDAHSIEILHAKLKIRQVKDKENASVFGNANNQGLSNSMMGTFGGGNSFSSSLPSLID